MDFLEEQFSYNYGTSGGSKLPVLAFYAIYNMIIKELERYKNAEIKKLSSHTASDKTSKSSGDIEIFKNNELFESIEIKLDKLIDITMIRIAKEKILQYNPQRYYILSYFGIKNSDISDINKLIDEIKEQHGCQIIVNGLTNTLKYYLRLISNPKKFMDIYIILVEQDVELKYEHKIKMNEFLKKYFNHISG